MAEELKNTEDTAKQTTEDTAKQTPEADAKQTPEADATQGDPETFPLAYVQKLRTEAAEARTKAKRAEALEAQLYHYC